MEVPCLLKCQRKDYGGIEFKMIQPNFDLMLWILFVVMSLKAIFQIVAGAMKIEKDKRYDGGDILAGIIWLIIVVIILIK